MKNKFMALCVVILIYVSYARSYTPLTIENAKLSTEMQAGRFADDCYTKKMKHILSATEGVGDTKIVNIGFDIPEFANKGDKIWEVRIVEMSGNRLRAILWVNPKSEKIYYVCGPWINESSVK